MPITHGDHDARVQVFPKLALERRGLPLGEFAQGRFPSNASVVLADFVGPARRDQPRQGRASDARHRKINDVGVGEKIVKERLDGLERVGPAQLKQHHAHRPLAAVGSTHLPAFASSKRVHSRSFG